MIQDVLAVSLQTANRLYTWGWLLSVMGAVVSMIGMAMLWTGTRVRDEDSEQQIAILKSLGARSLTHEQAEEVGKHLREHFPDLSFAVTRWDQESNNFAMQICMAAFGGFCTWHMLEAPQGSNSALVVPGCFGSHRVMFFAHTDQFTVAPEISDSTTDKSEWPEIERRAIELLGPLGNLGFLLVGAQIVPEAGDRPVLYIAPKVVPRLDKNPLYPSFPKTPDK